MGALDKFYLLCYKLSFELSTTIPALGLLVFADLLFESQGKQSKQSNIVVPSALSTHMFKD
jgi:hypothetical protein